MRRENDHILEVVGCEIDRTRDQCSYENKGEGGVRGDSSFFLLFTKSWGKIINLLFNMILKCLRVL